MWSFMYKKMIRMTDRRLLANTKVNAEFKIGFYKPGFTITSKFWSKNNILNDIFTKPSGFVSKSAVAITKHWKRIIKLKFLSKSFKIATGEHNTVVKD